jgi:hypothetical protein
MVKFYLAMLLATASLIAQIPTPVSVLGKEPGSDYYLASYDDQISYFRKLEAVSKKIRLVKVGKTTRGLDWYFALISSEANLAKLDRQKQIWNQLSQVRNLSDEAARSLAKEGKVLVHIDSGLHSTEVAPTQHAIPLAYHLLSAQGNAEVDQILDNVVLMLWFNFNPDGSNQVADWYRKNVGTSYEVAPMIELYQEYVGHDNNRDGYMNNMLESQLVTKMMLEWTPQVIYNHHQVAPFPARIWIPPFAEPVSDNVHPLMFRWVNVFGTSMAAYLEDRGMTGAIHRGNGFDDWYPGFIDHVNSFRNTVSFLTETALFSYATPKFYTMNDFPQDKRPLKSDVFYASPWKGGWWRLKDAVDYCFGASMSVLRTAALNKEQLLFNKYQAGRDTIKKYSSDPPYGFVIPSEQADAPTAVVMVEKLMLNGLEIHQANAAFELKGAQYPAGSWVVLMDQPYSALAKELLEVQKYPDLREYPGGPPDLPYDVSGWTLPLQMGVETVTVTEPINAEVRSKLKLVSKVNLPGAGVSGNGASFAAPWSNQSIALANALLKKKVAVGFNKKANELVVSDRAAIAELAERHNVTFKPTNSTGLPLKSRRIGLYRPWVTNIDEGWTRWLLKQHEFEVVTLRNDDMRAGKLDRRIDVLILPDIRPNVIENGHAKGVVPDMYVGGVGASGLDAIRDFVRKGGTLLTFNNSVNLAIDQLQLPVKNIASSFDKKTFFCGGSVLRAEADEQHPLMAGMPSETHFMFEESPILEISDAGKARGLLRYSTGRTALASGFLLGPEKLYGKYALVEANYGKGRVMLFGFRPQWRGQSHLTYKVIFNSLLATPEWFDAEVKSEKKEEKK